MTQFLLQIDTEKVDGNSKEKNLGKTLVIHTPNATLKQELYNGEQKKLCLFREYAAFDDINKEKHFF